MSVHVSLLSPAFQAPGKTQPKASAVRFKALTRDQLIQRDPLADLLVNKGFSSRPFRDVKVISGSLRGIASVDDLFDKTLKPFEIEFRLQDKFYRLNYQIANLQGELVPAFSVKPNRLRFSHHVFTECARPFFNCTYLPNKTAASSLVFGSFDNYNRPPYTEDLLPALLDAIQNPTPFSLAEYAGGFLRMFFTDPL
ncbi:MAG: hypothetical protein IPK79_11085 [Vampirovibrionales bacterium]|nr:hypothetical protein [Vampirovibrionales bacterium]